MDLKWMQSYEASLAPSGSWDHIFYYHRNKVVRIKALLALISECSKIQSKRDLMLNIHYPFYSNRE